ncbi:translin-like isoform X1 [Acanthaster planci]|uniref:Translin n=2 Tax=Acanthaster planci TaxID=133434 RepID=A0A8B7Z487_ACAPL|nr:translin-like isoform X1 [Acanthaster planci]
MAESPPVNSIFSEFNEYLTNDQDVREEIRVAVRAMEQTAREVMTTLEGIHQAAGLKEAPVLCQKARKLLETTQSQFAELQKKVPADQYYRFHDHWRFVSQRLSFLVALIVYLEAERLVTREEVAHLMGVSVRREDGFHLDLEDFLQGLLQLASELSRLAINSVTAGEYDRPVRISNFIQELNAGFRLLNLKNDSLRKRFDGLKYDIKKVEEVVYDISIRGLKPAPPGGGEEEEPPTSSTGAE